MAPTALSPPTLAPLRRAPRPPLSRPPARPACSSAWGAAASSASLDGSGDFLARLAAAAAAAVGAAVWAKLQEGEARVEREVRERGPSAGAAGGLGSQGRGSPAQGGPLAARAALRPRRRPGPAE